MLKYLALLMTNLIQKNLSLIILIFMIYVSSLINPSSDKGKNSIILNKTQKISNLKYGFDLIKEYFCGKKSKNNESNKGGYNNRNLFSFMETENNDVVLNSIENYSNIYYQYAFMKNISKSSYFGKWSNFSFNNHYFEGRKSGGAVVKLRKNFLADFIPSLVSMNESKSANAMSLTFFLKNGEYADYYFQGNTTFNFPEDFYSQLDKIIQSNKTRLTLYYTNLTISFIEGFYFDDSFYKEINYTNLAITFYIRQKNIHFYQEIPLTNTLFSRIEVNFENQIENFYLSLNGTMYATMKYSTDVLNYSILFCYLAILNIFFSRDFFGDVYVNQLTGHSTSLIGITIQIIWDTLICSVNFFNAVTEEKYVKEYGLLAAMHFIIFTSYHLKIMFIAFRWRYNDLYSNDRAKFKKKLFTFYFFFYAAVFLSLISFRLWNKYFISYLILYGISWTFQIIHSAKSNFKPPMENSYIGIYTFSRIVLAWYLKGYSNNVYGLRPSYFKVIIITILIGIQVIFIF